MQAFLQTILDKTNAALAGIATAQATTATIATDVAALKVIIGGLTIPQADLDTVNAAVDGLAVKVTALNTTLKDDETAAH